MYLVTLADDRMANRKRYGVVVQRKGSAAGDGRRKYIVTSADAQSAEQLADQIADEDGVEYAGAVIIIRELEDRCYIDSGWLGLWGDIDLSQLRQDCEDILRVVRANVRALSSPHTSCSGVTVNES